jgi:hypothetical protein
MQRADAVDDGFISTSTDHCVRAFHPLLHPAISRGVECRALGRIGHETSARKSNAYSGCHEAACVAGVGNHDCAQKLVDDLNRCQAM